jgi:hypothetical protein
MNRNLRMMSAPPALFLANHAVVTVNAARKAPQRAAA